MKSPPREGGARAAAWRRAPGAAYLAALAAGWAAMLTVDLPGHLTLDSLLELYEGRFRVRQSWAPSFYAWVLGAFDKVAPGTWLYVVASSLALVLALGSFVWLRGGRARWGAALLAALFGASPLLVIYQGIVWKDVLFADCAVAGMTALAWAVRGPQPAWRRGPELLAALLLLSAAALLRQNGILAGAAAAGALGWIMAEGRWRRGLAWALGALGAVIAVSHAMNLATQPGGPGTGDGVAEGVRVLQGYDLLGALAADPSVPLPAITAARPGQAATLRSLAPGHYSAERTDVTDGQPQIRQALDAIPATALASDWRGLVLRRPGLYLRERAQVFRWVFLTPRIERCVPVALGVQGPDDTLEALGLKWRWSAVDDRLLAYDKALQGTPAHAHLFYAVLALAVAGVLLRRRDPPDVVIVAMMAAGLSFAASFFVISIACDFRYLYFLDLAAMAGALYVALDPPWRGTARRPRQGGRRG